MRLFIAIDLPDTVKNYLRRLQSQLPQGRMSKTHDFHLTLKFLGYCDEKMLAAVTHELSDVPSGRAAERKSQWRAQKAQPFAPFEASLGEMDFFGSETSPRVIWVGMKVPSWLSGTAEEIEARMHKIGYQKEKRFVPHVTLARVKSIDDPQNFVKILKNIKVEPLKFEVRQFHLYESRLSSKGAIHIKLKSFPDQK